MTGHAAPADELELLDAAQGGDEQAFARLLAPYRGPLHRHSYRMLGSLHDADDALQDTMLRAWRALGGFEPRQTLRPWLYRIATNVCLRMIERREARPEPLDPVAAEAVAHLQPYPDVLLDRLSSPERPDLAAETRETIGLAYVSALQLLPARQRAVLLLREVLDWPAKEVADFLGDSVASVNSALQRARERLEREREAGTLAREHAPASVAAQDAVVREFLAAWEAVDVDRLVGLFTDEIVMTMPPEPLRLVGREPVGEFFRTVPAQGALQRIHLVPARANLQPALAAYLEDEAGVRRPYGVMVLALEGDRIASVTGFAGYPELFPALGLPDQL